MSITRTTISIDSQVLIVAKTKAAEANQTLGAYVEDALQRRIVAQNAKSSRVSLPVLSGRGLQPDIDPSSNSDYFARLDEEDVTRWSSPM